MPLRIQIVIGVVIVMSFIGITVQVHKNKLNLRFALPWMLLLVVLLILDIWPGLSGILAKLVGIEVPLNLLLFLGLGFTLLLIFGLTKRVSKMSDETKRLTQEVAILKEQIQKKEKEDTV